jgi:hypothetical protein
MKNFQRGFTAIELFLVVVIPLSIVGWGWNIVKIVQSMPDGLVGITGMFVARCIGVFVAPLGVILGYL